MTDESTEMAGMFKALGDPTRLRIFEFLRACRGSVAVDDDGSVRTIRVDAEGSSPTVGDVCCHVTGGEKVSSTVSFHLKELRQAGLIVMERRGKNLICGIAPGAPEKLANYFGGSDAGGGVCCDE